MLEVLLHLLDGDSSADDGDHAHTIDARRHLNAGSRFNLQEVSHLLGRAENVADGMFRTFQIAAHHAQGALVRNDWVSGWRATRAVGQQHAQQLADTGGTELGKEKPPVRVSASSSTQHPPTTRYTHVLFV
jgi:hypothetical protein